MSYLAPGKQQTNKGKGAREESSIFLRVTHHQEHLTERLLVLQTGIRQNIPPEVGSGLGKLHFWAISWPAESFLRRLGPSPPSSVEPRLGHSY